MNRTIMITGAASGIGKAMAKRFAQDGDTLLLVDKQPGTLERLVNELETLVYSFALDVTNEQDVKTMFDEIITNHHQLDVLINNAGFQQVHSIEEFPTHIFREMLDVMVLAPFTTMKHAVPIMKEQSSGRIINVASMNGLQGVPWKAGYVSAKHGIVGLTKTVALEVAENGITVNSIAPGVVDTPLLRNQLEDIATQNKVEKSAVLEKVIYPSIPQKRMIQPEEIADVAFYLASKSAQSITGHALVIDGGSTI